MNITPLQFRNASNMQTDVGVFKIKSEDEKEVNKKLLIIDTDIGGDCDDAGALALANIFKNEGLIDLLGMTFTTSTPYGPASISAINRFYGNDDIEIASTSRKHFCDINVNPFQKELALSFPNKYYDERTKQLPRQGKRDFPVCQRQGRAGVGRELRNHRQPAPDYLGVLG